MEIQQEVDRQVASLQVKKILHKRAVKENLNLTHLRNLVSQEI